MRTNVLSVLVLLNTLKLRRNAFFVFLLRIYNMSIYF
jgi:hypothetical protein